MEFLNNAIIGAPKKKRPAFRMKENAQSKVWTIKHKRRFDVKAKKYLPWGDTVVASQFKDKPYKINFRKLSYNVRDKKITGSIPDGRISYCFSVKSGRLNIFSITKNQVGLKAVKNCSNNF